MGGAKLKVIFDDSKTAPDGGVAEAERLYHSSHQKYKMRT